jgi:hypothetical protein
LWVIFFQLWLGRTGCRNWICLGWIKEIEDNFFFRSFGWSFWGLGRTSCRNHYTIGMDQKGGIDFFHIFVGWKILGSKLDGIFTYFCWGEGPSILRFPAILVWKPVSSHGSQGSSDSMGLAVPPIPRGVGWQFHPWNPHRSLKQRYNFCTIFGHISWAYSLT